MPIIKAAVREVDIRGVFRYANWYVLCQSIIDKICAAHRLIDLCDNCYNYIFTLQLSNGIGYGCIWQG